MGIDPLADDGGQQILSPYLAMGANPACNVDPLGLKFATLQANVEGGLAMVGYMIEGAWVTLGMGRRGSTEAGSALNEAMEKASAKAAAFQANLDAWVAVIAQYALGNNVFPSGIGSAKTGGTSSGKEGENTAKGGSGKGDDEKNESKGVNETVGVKELPIQKQPGENYCVYTCLSAIAKSYNRTLTPEDAEKKAEQLFIGGDWGISTYDIPLLAISLGFDISLIQSNGEPKKVPNKLHGMLYQMATLYLWSRTFLQKKMPARIMQRLFFEWIRLLTPKGLLFELMWLSQLMRKR